MGSSREALQTIRTDFGQTGLNISSSRMRADEASLYSLRNAQVGYAGILQNRYAFDQVGNQLTVPGPADYANGKVVSQLVRMQAQDWTLTGAAENNARITFGQHGKLNFYGISSTAASPAYQTWSRYLLPGENYRAAASTITFSFGYTLKCGSLFADAVTGVSSPGLHIAAACYGDSLLHTALTQDGMYVWGGGSPALIEEAAGLLDTGEVIDVEVRVSKVLSLSQVQLYINGTLIGTESVGSGLDAVTGKYFDVKIVSDTGMDASALCSGHISHMWIKDATSNTTINPKVQAVTERVVNIDSPSWVVRRKYAIAGKALWYTEAPYQTWSIMSLLPYEYGSFADFRDSLIVFNYDAYGHAKIYRLKDGELDLEWLRDAPNATFGAVHQNRLVVAGDPRYPLRYYYSADRDPSVWFSPSTDADGQETYDEVLNAGYFEADAKSGDHVSGLWGNYYGHLIVGTLGGELFSLTGTNFTDWRTTRIDSKVGTFGPQAIEQVGRDLWIAGQHGISKLLTVQEHGDLATQKISEPIQGVFNKIRAKQATIPRATAGKTTLHFMKDLDLLMMHVVLQDGSDGLVYLYRVGLDRWYGPWEHDLTCAGLGTHDYPEEVAPLLGGIEGKVYAMSRRYDYGSSATIESQVLTGRSVSPELVPMEKTWRNFRLIVNPTGNFDVTVSWKVEDKPWQSITKKLARGDQGYVGTTWTVNTSEVESREEPHVLDFKMGTRGRSLQYKITTSAPLYNLLSAEVEFTADGFAKGDE